MVLVEAEVGGDAAYPADGGLHVFNRSGELGFIAEAVVDADDGKAGALCKEREVWGEVAVSESPSSAMKPDDDRDGERCTRGEIDVGQARGASGVTVDLVSVDAELS